MTSLRHAACILFAALGLAGCIPSVANEIDAGNRRGQTIDEVAAQFGQPARRERLSDGTQLVMWRATGTAVNRVTRRPVTCEAQATAGADNVITRLEYQGSDEFCHFMRTQGPWSGRGRR